MRQFEIEARGDWKEIVTSIPCQDCGAAIGHGCIEQLAGTPRGRADYHASRKQSARVLWELKQIERTDQHIASDLDKLVDALPPKLSSIKIAFTKGTTMSTTPTAPGPVTLQSGQQASAIVLYFDQNGNPMPSSFVPPT